VIIREAVFGSRASPESGLKAASNFYIRQQKRV
jgi:hypothetical protein